MSPSSVQVGRVGPGDPVLDERDDHEDEQQRHRHRGGVAELEAGERGLVDVVLQHPGRVDRPARVAIATVSNTWNEPTTLMIRTTAMTGAAAAR